MPGSSKELGSCHTKKETPANGFHGGKRRRQELCSTQISWGGSQEGGPLRPVSGRPKSCPSFPLCLESGWPQKRRLTLRSQQAPPAAATPNLPSSCSCGLGSGGNNSKAKDRVSSSPFTLGGNENHWVQTRVNQKLLFPSGRKETHSRISLGFIKEELLAREL